LRRPIVWRTCSTAAGTNRGIGACSGETLERCRGGVELRRRAEVFQLRGRLAQTCRRTCCCGALDRVSGAGERRAVAPVHTLPEGVDHAGELLLELPQQPLGQGRLPWRGAAAVGVDRLGTGAA